MRKGSRSVIRLLVIASVACLLAAAVYTGGRMVLWKIAGASGSTGITSPQVQGAAVYEPPLEASLAAASGGSGDGEVEEAEERLAAHAPEEDEFPSLSQVAEEPTDVGPVADARGEEPQEEAVADAGTEELSGDSGDLQASPAEVPVQGDDRGAPPSTIAQSERAAGAGTGGWDNPLLELPTEGQLGQPSSPVEDEAALQRAAAVHQPKMGTNEFLPEYKNPCWHENGRLRCLPYVYFAGVFQSGTRDLYSRIAKHPQVVMPNNPSFHYWIEWVWEMEKFVELYDKAALEISKDPASRISFNGSPGIFTHYWAHSERSHMAFKDTFAACWKNCMESNRGNELQRACILTCFQPARDAQNEVAAEAGMQLEIPHLIRAVHGLKARFVVLLRNPTERLHHSFYFHAHYRDKYGNSPDGFMAYAREQIEPMRECHRKRGNWRECVLAFESVGPEEEQVFFHADQVCRGAYAVYLEDWLHAFPRENLLLLKAEEYYADPRPAVAQVVEFLGLDEPSPRQWEDMLRDSRGPSRAGEQRMRPDARAYVDAFYRPFNRALAEMLGDDRFLWEGVGDVSPGA